MVFEAIQGLVSRITDALGINANGFVLGVAVALFLWWSSNKDKELRAKQAALAAQQRDATAAAWMRLLTRRQLTSCLAVPSITARP